MDGEGAILGRLASHVAKQALLGNEVIVLNCEKVIISGNKQDIINKQKKLRSLGGTAQKGPFYPKASFMIVKRSIRGMLPTHREGVGREAFKRIKCYNDIPVEFEKEKKFKTHGQMPDKFIELKELSTKI